MKTAGAYLLLALLAQVTPEQLQKPFEVPTQKPPIPENLKNWPKSCQRLHLETNKCENGLKSCDQKRIETWRKRCERDEPRGQ